MFSPALRDYVSHVLPALGVDRVQVRDLPRLGARSRCRRLLPRCCRASSREDTPADVHAPEAPSRAADRARASRSARRPAPRDGRAGGRRLGERAHATRRCSARLLARAAPGAFSRRRVRARADVVPRALRGDRRLDRGRRRRRRPSSMPEDDAAPAARLAAARRSAAGRGGEPLRYRHVAIDEVQDFSPLEVRVLLGCLDEPAQHHARRRHAAARRHATAGFTSWATLLRGARPRGRRGRARSTSAIAARTRSRRSPHGVLGDLARGRAAAAHDARAGRRSSCSASPTTARASRSSPTRCRSSSRRSRSRRSPCSRRRAS